jgi:hypothetical protein
MDLKIVLIVLLMGAIIILVQYSDALTKKLRNRKQKSSLEG